MKNVEISYDEWYEKFKPVEDEHNDLVRLWPTNKDHQKIIEEAHADNKLWTILDTDGVQVIASGFHFVNRMDYVVTEIAHEEDTSYEVVDQEEVKAEAFAGNVLEVLAYDYKLDEELAEAIEDEANDMRHEGFKVIEFAQKMIKEHKL